MKKRCLLLMFLCMFTLLFTKPVYAKDNVTIDTKKEGENITITYSVGETEIFGMHSELSYDQNSIKVVDCNGENGFVVSHNQANNTLDVVAENTKAIKNGVIAKCTFTSTAETSSIVLKSITSSNGAVLTQHKESEGQLLSVENTFMGVGFLSTLFALLLIGGGASMIFKTKKSMIPILLLSLFIPFRVFAETQYTDEQLSTVRNILLRLETYDSTKHANLDFDGDKVITINDLISIKLSMLRPKVELSVAKTGDAEYATAATATVAATSTSPVTDISYCFGKTTCNPSKKVSQVAASVTIPFVNNKDPQLICVSATNQDGFTTVKCDGTTYLVDNVTPTFEIKDATVTITEGQTYDTKSNTKDVTYGVGGGSLECTSASEVGTHPITCTATGKNGLTAQKTYSLVINKRTYKVLFVGNSKTYVNDIPNTFKSIAEANGYQVTVTAVTQGGKTLQFLADNKADELSAVEGYDYLVLQEQYDALTAEDRGEYLNGAKAVYNIVKTKNPGIKTFVRAIWTHGQEGSDGNFYLDHTNIVRARENSEYVASQMNSTPIYDGKAFEKIDSDYHSIIILSDTTGHQTKAGAYLSAACIYKKIFNKSPVGTTFRYDLDESTANTLLSVANSVA